MQDGDQTKERAGTGWGWMLAFGILAILLGLVLLWAPTFTALAAASFVGAVIAVLGVAGIVMGVKAARPWRRWTDIGLGVLAVIVGVYTWLFPLSGSISIAFLLGVWLVLRGIVELLTLFRTRDDRGRVLLAAAGALDLVLGVLLLANFPFPAVAYLGIFVAVSFIMGGVSLVIAATGLRREQVV